MVMIGTAKREMEAVLDYANTSPSIPSNSADDFLSKMLAEGIMMPDDPANDNIINHLIERSAEDATTFGTTAVNNMVDNVVENISTVMDILSEEDIPNEYSYDETNDTFIKSSTVTDSNLPGNETSPVLRFLMVLGMVMLICTVITFSHLIYMMENSSRGQVEGDYSLSEVVSRYEAGSVSDNNPVMEHDGGVFRKTEALGPRSSSKSKQHTPLPFAWDMDGKIIAQTGDELEKVVTTNKDVKDSETQTMEENEDALTAEDLDNLNEKCKEYEDMFARLTED